MNSFQSTHCEAAVVVADTNLEAGYLEYYKAVQKIIGFVKGFVQNRDQYSYTDYKQFADTTVKLIGDLIDDYMAGNFKLWSIEPTFVNTKNLLSEISHKIAVDSQQKHDDSSSDAQQLNLYNDLIVILESSLDKQPSLDVSQ
ncbi:hypothetical protein [Orgyia pseudotsugata single capsid nuclopolyhedrovirus]|nr:hypothetical protein [Orgyia pseudotsugata single capsid nuclopolyhedrovirus]